jgi:hypothetical protein
MAQPPQIRFHICLFLDGEIVALCGESHPRNIVNAADPFNPDEEFLCPSCLEIYRRTAAQASV